MVDNGDIGGVVGSILGGYSAAKWVGRGLLTTSLGPAYIIGGTLLGYCIGHYVGHKLGGSSHHSSAPH